MTRVIEATRRMDVRLAITRVSADSGHGRGQYPAELSACGQAVDKLWTSIL
jgi:hypothetical protein